MEVKIGVTNSPRELTLETELDADGVEAIVAKALSEGSVFTLTDHRGRRIMVPAERLGYVEVTTSTFGQVGFRS